MSIETRKGYNPDEEKNKFKAEFLEKETSELNSIIEELEERRDKGEGRGIGDTIKWVKETKRISQLGMEFKIESFKKWLTPDELTDLFNSNSIKIENLKPDLENNHKSSITKQKIDDIERENRIITAIKEGKL